MPRATMIGVSLILLAVAADAGCTGKDRAISSRATGQISLSRKGGAGRWPSV